MNYQLYPTWMMSPDFRSAYALTTDYAVWDLWCGGGPLDNEAIAANYQQETFSKLSAQS